MHKSPGQLGQTWSHFHVPAWPCEHNILLVPFRASLAQYKNFATWAGGWCTGRDFYQVQRQKQPFKNKMFKLEHIIPLALNLKHHNITANNFSVHGFPRALTNCLQRGTSATTETHSASWWKAAVYNIAEKFWPAQGVKTPEKRTCLGKNGSSSNKIATNRSGSTRSH